MGLDISAYSRITKQPDMTFDDVDERWKEQFTYVYRNDSFPSHCSDVEEGAYSYVESFGFRAGSYSGYNNWREQLARFAGYLRAFELAADDGVVEFH